MYIVSRKNLKGGTFNNNQYLEGRMSRVSRDDCVVFRRSSVL